MRHRFAVERQEKRIVSNACPQKLSSFEGDRNFMPMFVLCSLLPQLSVMNSASHRRPQPVELRQRLAAEHDLAVLFVDLVVHRAGSGAIADPTLSVPFGVRRARNRAQGRGLRGPLHRGQSFGLAAGRQLPRLLAVLRLVGGECGHELAVLDSSAPGGNEGGKQYGKRAFCHFEFHHFVKLPNELFIPVHCWLHYSSCVFFFLLLKF